MANQENTLNALSYIATFFRDLEELNNTTAQYNNAVSELKHKYDKLTQEDVNKQLTEAERAAFSQIIQSNRLWCVRTYIKINALKERLKINHATITKLNQVYKTIKDTPAPKYDDAEEYTIIVNSIFVDGVAAELLKGINDYYSQFNAGAQ